jgi:ABC-type bacteriocin/lantibiotic exporter with double-glycine peptidase domain
MQEKRVSVVHKKITDAFIGELLKTQPIICHIDDHILGDYSHASHFIILEKTTKKFIYIIDPWSGKKKRIINTKLEKAISDLKNQVKMCPLLFSIEA